MAFDYSNVPLLRPQEQIRLLHLRPDSDDADIRVDLHAHDFGTCLAYVAISYTWGDTGPTLVIIVNGQPFRVRVNCWYALWQMRHHGHRDIWLDSICINQADIDEKNAQVAMMGEIYSKAAMTASCLGPGRSLAAAQEMVRSFGDGRPSILASLAIERDAFKVLQHNPYWRRIWIKQEIFLSQEVRVFCGTDWIEWDFYEDILNVVIKYDVRSWKKLDQHPKSKAIVDGAHTALVEGRKQRQNLVSLSAVAPLPGMHTAQTPWANLWQLFEEYGAAECHDPHDKVYALLPLMNAASRALLGLSIDYRLPLLPLGLRLVQGYLHEFCAMLSPDEVQGVVPVKIWQIMIDIFRYWFRLELNDPFVLPYITHWSTPSAYLGDCSKLGEFIGTPQYAPTQVMCRVKVDSIIASSFKQNWRNIRELARDDDSDDEVAYVRDRFNPEWDDASISETLSVEKVSEYLLEILGPAYAPSLANTEGPFTLSALSPHLQVKIVIPMISYMGWPDVYLVSPDTDIGDELLYHRLLDPYRTRHFISIVRPYEPTAQYAMLTGWALQLCRNGLLLDEPHVSPWVTRQDSNPDRSISDDDPVPEDVSTRVILNLHYEDLILHAMLLQDPVAYLMQPCTHREHPSFFSAGITANSGHGDHAGGEAREKKKAKKKAVGFA